MNTTEEQPHVQGSKLWILRLKNAVMGIGVGLVGAFILLLLAPGLRAGLGGLVTAMPPALSQEDSLRSAQQIQTYQRRLDGMRPKGYFLVVSATDNTFVLYKGGEVQRQGLCSTGSYVQLSGAEGREWLFETPRGQHRVLGKREKPVWVKPDWAFVEAGLPIPPPGSELRLERGVLGDYALALGDGYLIHGTLYQRLLGQPVTHGCIRLGDADLEAVFKALPVGAQVFIY